MAKRTRPSESERFWAKVNKNGPLPEHRPDLGPCWLWLGYLNEGGYGTFSAEGRRTRKAHRWSYQDAVGDLPDDLVVDHLCRVPACVNPAHLEAVTQYENLVVRGHGNFSATNARKTHCPQGHPLSGTNVYKHPDGSRRCRACQRLHDYKRRHP